MVTRRSRTWFGPAAEPHTFHLKCVDTRNDVTPDAKEWATVFDVSASVMLHRFLIQALHENTFCA